METEYRTGNTQRLSAVRRDLENVNDRIDVVNTKLETLQFKINRNPEWKNKIMDTRTQRLLELEDRHKLHSAQLKLLQKEVDHVQTENDLLMSYVKENESPRGFQHQIGNNDKGPDGGMFTDSRLVDNKDETAPRSPDRSKHATPQHRPIPETKGGFTSPRMNESDPPGYQNANANSDQKWRQLEMQLGTRKQSDDYDFEELERLRRSQIYGFHDSTAINPQLWDHKPKHRKYPWFDHKTHPHPGGFMLMRFDDAGYEVCSLALKQQQSICRNAGGYLMGMARKDRIYVFESAPSKQKNWTISRRQRYKDCMTTEDGLALFWFTRKDAATAFFENCHRNRFRDPCFPTANGYEAVYVPLLTPPIQHLNTFFCVELLDARHYSQGDLTQFEMEVSNDMLRCYPRCLPMVVSSQTGREMLKPGMLISYNSKFYMSRFESQREVDHIWSLGMIQALREKWHLTGPINVFSFSMDLAV